MANDSGAIETTNVHPLRLGGITFVGASSAFQNMFDMLCRIARTDATVLIEGETGTGKELAARAIHYESARRSGPFIPINCGAIPDALVESEFFGHRRGAFTDAKDSSPGILRLAHTGSIFLDEVDALSSKAQVVLLRFLQNRCVRQVGDATERTVDVRVLAASNTPLAGLVQKREFRQDLFYRLHVLQVELPPLRDRGADAELLADHFLSELCSRYGRAKLVLDRASKEWLLAQSWPGNIRQLENCLEREVVLSEDRSSLRLSTVPPRNDVGALVRGDDASNPWNYRHAKACALEKFDRRFLETLLHFAQGNVSFAARLAGKERRDLGRLLRKYEIAPRTFRPET